MIFRNLWTNFSNVLGQVGSFVNKHMPTVLKGVKTVSKFFERSHNPAVSSIAQMVTKGADLAQDIHTWYNQPTSEIFEADADDTGTAYKTLTICSRDLKNGILYLPQPLSVRGVKVNSAYLCNSWHKANKVYLTQSRGALTFPGTITVPDGNYTVETFTATLKSLLNNAPSAYLWQGTWDVQVDSTTQKMRLANDTVDFTIGTGTASLNVHMGFVGAYGYSKVQYASALVNISPINLLHVYSRNLGTRLADNMYSAYPQDNGVLCSIHVTQPFGSWFEHRPHMGDYFRFDAQGQAQQIDCIDIDVVDKNLRSVNFLGQPFYVELAFI
ncbi:hypothetical protein H9P43_007340 [Blastocladiella emersonii ATCC 22665]|nr:hypothetical protein H9P43_007340 [Blastocladiella emersonii ATCC 22665]